MRPAEVADAERVPRLGLVVGPLGEPEVPCGVVIPGVLLEVVVLGSGVRLALPLVAVEDVLTGVDQLARGVTAASSTA